MEENFFWWLRSQSEIRLDTSQTQIRVQNKDQILDTSQTQMRRQIKYQTLDKSQTLSIQIITLIITYHQVRSFLPFICLNVKKSMLMFHENEFYKKRNNQQ